MDSNREEHLRVLNLIVSAALCLLLISNQQCQAGLKPGAAYQKRAFVSRIDGTDDSYALAYPSSGGDATLLVYLHGLNQDYTEPFKTPSGVTMAQGLTKEFPHLAILSCNYGRTPSWGTRLAREDITENIHTVMQNHPVSHIILAGNSMGACSALLYACNAPKDIADKTIGIVAAFPSADLSELHKVTEAPLVKSTLESALGKKPSEDPVLYRQMSLESQLPFFPRHIKVGIISANGNTVFPPKLQTDVARLLKNRDVPVKLIKIDGNLQPPPVKSMIEAMQFVVQ